MVLQSAQVGRWMRALRGRSGDLLIFSLATLSALLYAGWFRPLWIDEVGQLALGVVPAGSVLQFLYETSGPNINRGQTGLYNLIDWALVRTFGANAAIMRLPSLISMVLLLMIAAYFMRLRGFGRGWQVLVILAFVATPAVMQWSGQARIYAPLALTAVAIATFYQIPVAARKRPINKAVAGIAFPLGATLHPYWLVFVLLLSFFALWTDGNMSFKRLLSESKSLPFQWLVPSVLLYVALGIPTWMRGNGGPQSLWEQHGPIAAVREFVYLHSSPLTPTREIPPRILLIYPLVLLLLVILVITRRTLRDLAQPLGLLLTAATSSILIAISNVVGSYWIEARQWIAGASLSILALVWLAAESWRLGHRGQGSWRLQPLLLRSGSLGLALVIVVATADQIPRSIRQWQVDRHAWEKHRDLYQPDMASKPKPATPEEFNELATINAAVGGPVWPSVGSFYAGYPGVPE